MATTPNTRKKLLILIPNYQPGGTERVVSNLCPELRQEYNIMLVKLYEREVTYQYHVDHEININSRFDFSTGILNKLRRYLDWYKTYKRLLKEFKPDIVVSFGEIPNFITSLSYALGNRKHKLFLNVRNTESVFIKQKKFSVIYTLQIRWMYRFCDKILCNSEGIRDDLKSHFSINKPISVIPNPCVTETYQWQGLHSSTILSVGRLTEQKGQAYLIDAYAMVAKAHPNSRLCIIGEGELYETLKQTIEQRGLTKNITILGWQKAIQTHLDQAKVFVLPSLWEGMPNALLEAMARGCPCVSFDCPSGPREIINRPGENGLLIDTKDVEGLAAGIIKLLDNNELAQSMSQAAYCRAQDFSVKNIARQFSKVFNDT